MTHLARAEALQWLGQQERGTASLEASTAEAKIVADALVSPSQELDRARALQVMGISLLGTGDRQNDNAILHEAITALSELLVAYTIENQGYNWANTRNELGIAHLTLGERTGDVTELEAARERFMQALKS
jgi:hypothetical protein